MEGEQEGRGKNKKVMRTGRISPKTLRTTASNAITTSVAKKAENASTVGDNRVCSDGGSGENKYRNNMVPTAEGRV